MLARHLSKGRWLAWLGLGISSVAGLMLFYSYKWAILTGLGFSPPVGMCQEKEITQEYLFTGGELTQIQADNCLLRAVINGRKDIAELLIDKGADVNIKDNDGNTPLQSAVIYGYKDIV